MLSKEEFAAFLALLLNFAKTNGFSAAMCGRVLSLNHQTIARWVRQARSLEQGVEPVATAYTYLVEPVKDKITRLNELNDRNGLYTAIAREKPQTKEQILLGALDGRTL